ncbi:MAG: ABC transporter permease subunit [Planctomycetes bacterium]|nr:ABC transporter permease subunit [Planctomycetota bacterium]
MIARKTWREVRGMTLAYTVIIELLLLPAILLWPNLRRGGSLLVEMMPAQFLKDMARQIMGQNDEAAYLAYMAVQMFFKGINIVGIAAAVLMGTGLIARERENQTLEFLLARPVSRSRILAAKYVVVGLAVVVPIFLTSWTAVPLSRIESVAQDLPFDRVTIASLHNAAFVLLVYTATLVFSILARAQVHAAFWIGAVVISQVAIYFIQEIRVYSLFRCSDFEVYGPVMAGNTSFGELFWGQTIWLLVATAALYALADALFRRTGP